MLYMVRTLPLRVGESVFVPIFDRGATWHTEIQVLARERLKLSFGSIDTLKVKPLLHTAGIFRREGDVFVWLRVTRGRIERAHVRDASVFQWPLLEAAIEGNIVADFPLCNKSFNCSYSGHDG